MSSNHDIKDTNRTADPHSPPPDAARIEDRARNFRDRFAGTGTVLASSYRGIPIFAAPGLHERALACLQAALPEAAATRVLELGAGGGAMSLRLADHGYRVTASDLFESNFTPLGQIPFRALDLNGPFAAQLSQAQDDRFDAVVALELIEHLENPHHFFRQCRALLREGGRLLVSTPNLANPASQALFLRRGVFQWFRDEDYREQGHISPIAPFVMRRCWTEAGFTLEWEGSVSNPIRMLRGRHKRRMRLLARLLGLLSGTPRALRGEVYLAVLRAD